MGHHKCCKYFLYLLFFALAFGCSSKKLKGQPEDTTVDLEDDGIMADSFNDIVDDVEQEEELPENCSGSDTFTLVFVDLDGNPVPELVVALKCLNEQFEGTTDAGGQVSFENLNLNAAAFEMTCVGENYAYTLTGIGGSRPLTNPLTITLKVLEWFLPTTDFQSIEGEIIRNQPESDILIWIPYNFMVAIGNIYYFTSPVDTNIPMSVFEFIVEEDVSNPIGYSFVRYDLAPGEVIGPDAAPEPAEFQSASVIVEYDIAEDSPLNEPSRGMRGQDGVFIRGIDSDGKFWHAGIPVSWTRGETFDTIEVAWTEEALAEAVEVRPHFSISGYVESLRYSYYVTGPLPWDSTLWTSVTAHDPPIIIGMEEMDTIPFNAELLLEVPPRVNLVRYNIWSENLTWFIDTPSERTSIILESLPWPSTVSLHELLESIYDRYPALYLEGLSFDEDPFENYQLWNDLEWYDDHYKSKAMVLGLDFDGPKD